MIKKSLLTTLLIIGCLWGAGELRAQEIIQIGSGTSTSSDYPAKTNTYYSYSQQIYTLAEIGAKGTISSIAFSNYSNSTVTRTFDIYMVNTDKSVFSNDDDWIAINTMTQVGNAISVTIPAKDWYTINITPFEYTGNNIAIAIYDHTNSSSTSISHYTYSGTYGNNTVIYTSSSSVIDLTSLGSGARKYSNPQIKLNITYTYPRPTSLNVSSITTNSAVVSWTAPTATAGNEFNSYECQYQEVGASEWTLASASSNSCSLTDCLEPGTNYTFRVRAVYTETSTSDTKYSLWNDIAFKTPCDPFSLTYEYGFEDASDLDCWTMTNCYNYSSSMYTGIINSNARTGTNSFRFYYNSSFDKQYLISPELTTNTNGVHFEFYYKCQGSSTSYTQKFKVAYSTTTNEPTAFDWDHATLLSVNTDTYTKYEIDFEPENEIIKYIAIQYIYNKNYHLFIDDVKFSNLSSCSTPTGLEKTGATSTTATLNWTAAEGQDHWDIYYSTSSTSPTASTDPSFSNTTTKPYTIEGLDAGTTYYAWVRGNCGSVVSDWSDGIDFSTSCDASSIPFNYGFESDMNCWTMVDNHYSSPTNYTGKINSDYRSGSYCFRFATPYQGSTQYLISPELDNTSKGVIVGLYHKQQGNGATIQIGYSTTDNATAHFTWGEASTNGNTGGYVYFEQICPPGTTYIAVKYVSTTTVYIYLDDISFTVSPDIFTTTGNWNTTAYWSYGALPTASDNVIINAACTIPNSCTAEANNITIGSGGSLTIADGGQLVCNNNPRVTMHKSIDDWNTTPWYFIASPVDGNINPVDVTNLINETTSEYDLYRYNQSASKEWENYKVHGFNLANGQGYLYANADGANLSFTGAINPGDPEESYTHSVLLDYSGTESTIGWNLVGNPFTCNATLDKACYTIKGNQANASSSGTTIAPGTGVMVKATGTGQSVTFTKAPNIAPNTTPDESSNNNIQLVLSQTVNHRGTNATETLDNAIVSFNEGSELSKFYFGTQNANIYIPQNGKEFAIVSAGNQNMVPVNFKAHVDGQYTLTFSSPQTSALTSLHLIDNLTGANVDLLQTPSYTFQGRTTDIAARFRLLFTTTGVDENDDQNENHKDFAFISDGQLIVNGTGTLYVYDALGRQVSVEQLSTVNCLSTANYPTGLYLLQLVDGNSVRTQKIIVK